MLIIYLLISSYIATLVSFFIHHSKFLLSLLCLEGILLSLVILIPFSISYYSNPTYTTALIILTMGACEARLGLSLVVKISRNNGSDNISILTINKC